MVDSISVNKSELRIPSYRIHRVEKLSSAFDQGKIFLTVNENYSSDVLKLICEKLQKIIRILKYRYMYLSKYRSRDETCFGRK